MATMTLTEFLLARIAEDEAVARGIPKHYDGRIYNLEDPDPGEQAFVDHYDAKRVLAECAAKRPITALHDNRYGLGDCVSCADGWQDLTSGESDHAPLPYPCPTLRALAAVYADHPDYREEWRP